MADPRPSTEYVLAALRGEVARVRRAPEGERNHSLNRAAFSLGQLVADGLLNATTVEDELSDAARDVGLGRTETRATIRSGLRSGRRVPRALATASGSRQVDPSWPPERARTPEEDWEDRCRRVDAWLLQRAAEMDDATDGTGEPEPEPEVTQLDRLRAALVDAEALELMAEPVPLVGKMLYLDSLAWLYGAPGSCKSFIALDIAGCVGTGESWHGQGRTMQGAVLYVVAEGVTGIRARVRAWEAAMGSPMRGVKFLPVAVQAASQGEWSALIALAAELKPALIVVDTQARVTVGMEENSATEMGEFVQRVEQLRAATGACVLVIHHTGRSGEHLRGSIALDGAATTLIKVVRSEELIEIECTKQKDGAEFEPLKMRLLPYQASAIVSLIDQLLPATMDSPAVKKIINEWWSCFETQWVSVKTLVDTTGVSRATFYRSQNALLRAHFIETKGEGSATRYRLLRQPPVSSVSSVSPESHETPEGGDIDESLSLTVSPPFRGETDETRSESGPLSNDNHLSRGDPSINDGGLLP
jgi:hypothetical protein